VRRSSSPGGIRQSSLNPEFARHSRISSLKALAVAVAELDYLITLAAPPNGPSWPRPTARKRSRWISRRCEFPRRTAETNPARRVGATADVSAATRSLPANPFVTGTTPHVDGGGRLSGNPDPLHGLRLFL